MFSFVGFCDATATSSFHVTVATTENVQDSDFALTRRAAGAFGTCAPAIGVIEIARSVRT
jgi:hypothetical protein